MTTKNEIKPAAPAEAIDGGRCAVDAGLAVLRKRRKHWRTEATRLRKNHEQYKNLRDWYEMNIYEACANQLDEDIRRIASAANTQDQTIRPAAPAVERPRANGGAATDCL